MGSQSPYMSVGPPLKKNTFSKCDRNLWKNSGFKNGVKKIVSKNGVNNPCLKMVYKKGGQKRGSNKGRSNNGYYYELQCMSFYFHHSILCIFNVPEHFYIFWHTFVHFLIYICVFAHTFAYFCFMSHVTCTSIGISSPQIKYNLYTNTRADHKYIKIK